ncbi:TetR family transcriptional regulator [Virgisporangium aliadipatigenens]|uniref:TetR family transcriptional regulator n=1 Tax=Virgisporangium aliadipatigenens TaxID=741659 RepID=A0A8J3YS56_9ACTN|nr:TetR/AcrR family transcriptional regulator [Virgisporangium aliadipatigenens]GIJ49652.1 TetR family transcriptional regulator [Virgisporangium aliadipatigenens]
MAEEEHRSSLSGRRAEAQRNNGRILDSARVVFLADPEAPIANVAAHAGVGVSALYRRYPSKEHLLRALAEDGLNRYVADLETALASDATPWDAYVACLERVVDGQSQALAQRLAGTFTPTEELTALAKRAAKLGETLFQRVRRSGELRDDVSEADVTLLLEMIAFIELPGADGGAALRRRYLALLLQALHAPAECRLPGRPARQADLMARWQPGAGDA